jgi:hypothetical protein
MTEADWDAATQPQTLLQYLRDSGVATDRKMWLLAATCCFHVPPLLPDASPAVVHFCERLADGLASTGDLRAALEAVNATKWRAVDGQDFEMAARLRDLQLALCGEGVRLPPEWRPDAAAFQAELAAFQAELAGALAGAGGRGGRAARCASFWQPAPGCATLRELFNPFRPITLDPSCLTPTVLSLANASYTERLLPSGHLDRSRLLVLADALLDAGCTDAVLLEHLRGEGPHWRGCWAVDAVLGKG